MINEGIDLAECRARLTATGRVQVADFLQDEPAQRIHACLHGDVPWTLALRDDAGARTLDHATYAGMAATEVASLLANVAAGARSDGPENGFRFAYDSYMMVSAYLHGRDPGLLLHEVLEFLNSPRYLDFARELTGDASIRRINAQATRYRKGHFLRYHTDIHASEGRRFAYVINLTRQWNADWGGLLQFIDEGGSVVDTFMPRWNSLSLFSVPAGHAVSLVSPWAEGERLAITGWMLA